MQGEDTSPAFWGFCLSKMNIFRMIELMLVFVVAYLLWAILRWTVLPHLKVWPYIPPQAFWTSGYNIVAGAATAVFHWVLAFIVFIYIVWKIINTVVPAWVLFIPLRSIFLAIPPFPQFTKAGIFDLLDRIVKIIFSAMPMKQRIISLGQAFQSFFNKSIYYVINNLKREITVKFNATAPRLEGAFRSSGSGGSGEASRAVGQTPDEILQEKEVAEQYQQCLDENILPVGPEMGSMEKAMVMARNSATRSTCGLKKMQTYFNLLSFKD